MVPGIQWAWDGATLAVCSLSFYFVLKLYLSFRGGTYGQAYTYYLGASLVLLTAFAAKLTLDFVGIQPEDFGVSVRDSAVIVALILFALGLRMTKKFWSPTPVVGASGSP